MDRRNFITTGLLGALPLPSFDFATAKPEVVPKTLNELLVKLEQDTQYLIKSKVESWGFEVIEGWPSWDRPETLYYRCGVIVPKLRLHLVRRVRENNLGPSVDSADIADVESFSKEVADKTAQYMQDVKHSFHKIVFLQSVASYQQSSYSHTYIKQSNSIERKYHNNTKVFMDVHFDWVRKDSVKVQNRAHLQQLLNHGRPHAQA